MNHDPAGARLAFWWAEAVTRTAPPGLAVDDRLAEIRSDVHEQILAAEIHGERRDQVSRCLASRVVRGIPADLVWRAQLEWDPARLGWHLHNPSTVLTTAMVGMLPVGLLANATGQRVLLPQLVHSLTQAMTLLMCYGMLAFAAAAASWRLGGGRRGAASLRLPPMTRSTRLRRLVTASMAIFAAMSATAEHAPSYPAVLTLSSWAWGAFGICLLVYFLLVTASLAGRIATRTLALGKIPSYTRLHGDAWDT